MPTSLQDLDNEEKNNPGSWNDSTGRRLSDAEINQTFDDQINNSYSPSERDNLNKIAKDAEESQTDSTEDSKLRQFGKNIVSESQKETGKKPIKLNFNPKSAGPIAAITGALSAVVAVVGVLFAGPSAALNVLSNSITNTFDTATVANRARIYKLIANKVGNVQDGRVEAACRDDPASVRCTRNTFSDQEIENLERNRSIRVVTSNGDFGGRTRASAIEFIDSSGNVTATVRTQAEFRTVMRSATARNLMNLAFNPSTAPMNDSRTNKLLSTLWKTAKSKVMKESSNDDELRDSFRESANIDTEGTGENGRVTEEDRRRNAESLTGRATELGKKIMGKATGNPTQVACGVYYGAKAMVVLVTAEQITRMVNFSLAFLREADRARAGDGYENISRWLNDKLNYSESNELTSSGEKNRFYKTTAWDSQGMRYAVSGNAVALAAWSKKYVAGGSGKMAAVDTTINAIEETMGGAKNVYRTCRIANSVAGCASAGGPVGLGFCAISGLPIVGDLVGGLAATVLEPIIRPVASYLLTQLMNAPVDDSVRGIDAGDVISAGGGLMLTHIALNRGAKLLTKEKYQHYVASTAGARQEIAEEEQLKARDTPFDTTNQYSFFGSITNSLYQNGIIKIGDPFGFNISTVGRVLQLPSMAFSPATVGATKQGFSQPMQEFSDAQFSPDCPFLQEHGLPGASGCVPTTGFSDETLGTDINAPIDFMESGDYADKKGEPTDTDNGKKFKYYLDYCVNGGPVVGASSGDTEGSSFASYITGGAAEDLTLDWETRYNCAYTTDDPGPNGAGANSASSKELSMFSAYVNDGANNATSEEGAAPDSDTGGGESTGEMVVPVKGASQLTSCYGLRPAMGDMHYALDIAGAGGSEIIASDGGEVTQVVNNNAAPFTGFGRSVVIKHGGDIYSRYSHLQSISVKVGDKVDKGQTIAIQGGSGGGTPGAIQDGAYPPHLDFGISTNPNVPNTADTSNPLKNIKLTGDVTNPHGCSAEFNGEASTKDDPKNKF